MLLIPMQIELDGGVAAAIARARNVGPLPRLEPPANAFANLLGRGQPGPKLDFAQLLHRTSRSIMNEHRFLVAIDVSREMDEKPVQLDPRPPCRNRP